MPKSSKKASAKPNKKEKRAGKTRKDPNAPKRGLTAFMFYSAANRQRVKEENPDAKFGEMGKLLGAEWKALPEEDKMEYQEMANDDKERYEREMKNYDGPTMIPAKGKKAKKTGPKRPSSAYICFSKEARERIKEEQPDLTFGEIGKEIGAQWKVLDADEKARYEELAAQDKARYEAELRQMQGQAEEDEVESEEEIDSDADEDEDDEEEEDSD